MIQKQEKITQLDQLPSLTFYFIMPFTISTVFIANALTAIITNLFDRLKSSYNQPLTLMIVSSYFLISKN
jgi:hypothetical protein